MPRVRKKFSCEEFTEANSAHYNQHYYYQEEICDVAYEEAAADEWIRSHPGKTLEDWKTRVNFKYDADAAFFEPYYLVTIKSEKGTYYGHTLTKPANLVRRLMNSTLMHIRHNYEVEIDKAENAAEARRWIRQSIKNHDYSTGDLLNENRVPVFCEDYPSEPSQTHYQAHYQRGEEPCYESKRDSSQAYYLKRYGTLEGWSHRPFHTEESVLAYCESDEFNANGKHYQAHKSLKIPNCIKALKEISAYEYKKRYGTIDGWVYYGRGKRTKSVSKKLGTAKRLSDGYL